MGFNPMTGVFIRKGKFINRHTNMEECPVRMKVEIRVTHTR